MSDGHIRSESWPYEVRVGREGAEMVVGWSSREDGGRLFGDCAETLAFDRVRVVDTRTGRTTRELARPAGRDG